MNIPNPEALEERLADSTTLTVLSRLSMLLTPLMLAAIVFLGQSWIDQKFDAQAAISHELRRDVDGLTAELPIAKERIKVVETTMVRGREDREEFQRMTTIALEQIRSQNAAQFERINAQLSALSAAVAALTATLDAQQRQIDRRR